jgi:hypothetical protein
VSGTAALVGCDDFWADEGTASSTVLSPASANPTGWADNTAYDFVLEWRPGNISITLSQGQTEIATLTSNDATYTSGSFGFYNYSQEAVRYELVQFEPLP